MELTAFTTPRDQIQPIFSDEMSAQCFVIGRSLFLTYTTPSIQLKFQSIQRHFDSGCVRVHKELMLRKPECCPFMLYSCAIFRTCLNYIKLIQTSSNQSYQTRNHDIICYFRTPCTVPYTDDVTTCCFLFGDAPPKLL